MNDEKLLEDIRSLPPATRRILEDFVEFLRSRYKPKEIQRRRRLLSLEDSPFFGMWADREDMQDSAEWVRKLRAEEWGLGDG